MPVLLSLGKRAHGDIVLFEPATDSVWIAPLGLGLSIDASDFDCAQLFFDVLLSKPIFVLIESLGSKCLAHDKYSQSS